MTVTNKANAEHYVWGQVCEGWRLLARNDLSVIQEHIPPGRGEVRHFHQHARQVFFVLDGALEIEVDREVSKLGPGDALEVAPGVRHLVWNPFEADASFLVISAPSTQGDRINVADGPPAAAP